MPEVLTAEPGRAETLEALQMAQRQAQVVLSVQLRKYGWSVIPRRSDPDGQAFWSDLEAVEAVRAYRQVEYRLCRSRRPTKYQEANRRYYESHRQEVIDRTHKYYEEHQQEIAERSHEYHSTHLSEAAARGRKYREVHQDEAAERTAAWYRDHPGAALEYTTKWRHNHPDLVREARHRRRARELETEGTFTEEEFRQLCQKFGDTCAYCGRDVEEAGTLVPDHVIPLSQGGPNYIWNILPACPLCNSKKGAKDLEEFLELLAKEETKL